MSNVRVYTDNLYIHTMKSTESLFASPENADFPQIAHFSLERAKEMIFWVDETGRFIYVNPSVCQELQYSRAELYRMQPEQITFQYDAGTLLQLQERLYREEVIELETILQRKDGSTFPVWTSMNVLRYRGQAINCSFSRNISERKALEAKLQQDVHTLAKENEWLKRATSKENKPMIGRSKKLLHILRQADRVAQIDIGVHIGGETGTGKELLARYIHAQSPRANRPLISVNCAAISEQLIDSELFGHEAGSFTGAQQLKRGYFELADGGTLFLDEVGELPLSTQAKVLRVLQEHEFYRIGGETSIRVDTRVIVATNRDLGKMVREGCFREDLYYRLNGFPIELPPLRERLEDLPELVDHFVEEFTKRSGIEVAPISEAQLQALRRYPFPGNIRELRNIIERAILLSEEGQPNFEAALPQIATLTTPESLLTLEEIQRQHIIRALRLTGGKVSGANGAANLLKMNANTLTSTMRRLGISRKVVFSAQYPT